VLEARRLPQFVERAGGAEMSLSFEPEMGREGTGGSFEDRAKASPSWFDFAMKRAQLYANLGCAERPPSQFRQAEA
jgi:hypothetical protein